MKHSVDADTAFSRHTNVLIYNKYICQKKEKQQYISVGTVRMFIEPGARHFEC
jgi:hypothetical protein